MKAVAYARFSSDKQRDNSIDEQLFEIREFAKKYNYTIIKEYADYAVSGASDNRPGFQQMIKDSYSREFEFVLIFDYTRFSRQGDDGLFDELLLKRNGISLISINEEITDDFGGKLTKYIKYLTAQDDLVKIKRNTNRALRQNALQAKHNGGTPPFGYDVDPETKKYIINETEKVGVEIIFEMFAVGHTYNEIINKLNGLGFKTKRNKNEFKKTTVHEIIRNKKYYGLYEYGKITKTAPNNSTYKSSRVENDNYIRIENGIPPIVSKDLWERANTNIKKRQPRKDAHLEYLLRNKIKCGVCGNSFVGTSRYSRNRNEGYYICSTRTNKGTCKNRAIKQSVIEGRVLEEIKETYFTPTGHKWIKQELNNINKNIDENKNLAKIKILQNKEKSLNNKLSRLKDAYLNGTLKLLEYDIDKKKLESSLIVIETEIVKLNQKAISIDKTIESVSEYKTMFNTDKQLIQNLIKKIVINGSDIKIALKYPIVDNYLHNIGGERGI